MSDAAKLLDAIKGRRSQSGVITADRYFREVEGCFGDGFCPVKMGGAESADVWKKALHDAASKLTFSSRKTRIIKESISSRKVDGSILQFDCVVTTAARDLDGDVLETKGAEIDRAAPLLWQHVHFQPTGITVEVLDHTPRRMLARCAIADTALGRDAAMLVKLGALRISHGFEPVEYEPMDDAKGWRFSKFRIFEISLVSLPANPQAIITAIGSKSFKSNLVNGWAKAKRTSQTSPNDKAAALTVEIAKQTATAVASALAGPLGAIAESLKARSLPSPRIDKREEADDKAELKRMEAQLEKKLAEKFDTKGSDMSGADLMLMAAGDIGHDDSHSIRVKGVNEPYDEKRAVLKHPKFEMPIHPIRNGVMSESPIESLSELENAKIGAFMKWKAARAGLCTVNENERRLLEHSWEHDIWVGHSGDETITRKNVKALINDNTSGGENLVPEYFDRAIVSFPLLHSELLPFVDVVDVPRGSSVETASVGNPTVVWNQAEASAQTLFNTAGLIAPITASIFPVAVYLQIGRDLMADSVPMIGQQLVSNIGQRIANELDKVIAAGDGVTQPQGITEASGTVDVTPSTPTSGPVTIDDLLNLMFGVAKQYRVPAYRPRFAMTDARYKSHRALATGVTGDDRLLHGMSVQNYTLLEAPVSIENSGLTNELGIFGAMAKYRLWRRAGFETGFERGGDTLVRSNTFLLWGRGRYGGKVVDGNAFAITDGWSAVA